MALKIKHSKVQPLLPGANELKQLTTQKKMTWSTLLYLDKGSSALKLEINIGTKLLCELKVMSQHWNGWIIPGKLHWNRNVIRMNALIVTGDAEHKI